MEKKPIFVITMSTGQYDSFTSSVIGITEDFAKGEVYVEKMNKTFSSMEKKVQSFYEKEFVEWQKNNPKPKIEVKGLIEIPKWGSKQKITKEMRDKRKNLELKNSEICRKANEPSFEWFKQADNFCKDWFKSNLTKDEFEIYLIRDNNYWSIEETEWV